ncbi:hypothetical protein [Pseudomarimonas arenosa]|uniref:DUF541 domain-containing protein n=1 Tax=Pseudomarimonas arenosa TaxID=2774145 RepID=A0AAW3ZP46_9GAMM|nr:hypothetical protein [Pseudomarimonas arenosa]MBD8526106.1 hypothetical protein [Pseudomarimonas arenosa]
MKRCTAALLALALPLTAGADDSSTLDRIEVTGSSISYRDLLHTPAIAITKHGDYLSQGFSLINDSRDAERRKQEIHSTIEKLLARSGKRYSLIFEDGYSITLNAQNHRVELLDDSKRPDVSRVKLRLRLELPAEAKDGLQIVADLREFVRSSVKVGRTEIELDTETALGMKRPERYRYELIEAIAEDSQRLRRSMGSGCSVELEGLNSRIEWERVGPVELMLYIPYSMTVSGCSEAPTP